MSGLGSSGREIYVQTVVGMLANLLVEEPDQLGRTLTGSDHQLHEKEAAEDAVPLRDVSTERVAAALLSGSNRILQESSWGQRT